MSRMKTNEDSDQFLYKNQLTVKGSLGILAYGDLAFRSWRELKIENVKKEQEK